MGQDGKPNPQLADLLTEAGWSPAELARRINQTQLEMVSRSTPYKWRDRGVVPRPPLPEIVAGLLSTRLGRPVRPDEIWDRATTTGTFLRADDGIFDGTWTPAGTVTAVSKWAGGGPMERRTFLAIGGSALASTAVRYLQTAPASVEPARLAAVLEGDSVGSTLISQIEAALPGLRSLDHRFGGGQGQLWVYGQHYLVAALIASGKHRGPVSQRLLRAFAELSDLAGYMAFDTEQPGLAQRYYLTGIRAAHSAADPALAASLLGNLAYATASDPAAVEVAEAAVTAAASAPAAVRAAAASRLLTATACTGDAAGQAHARVALDGHLDRIRPEDTPAWSTHVTSRWAAAQTGQALLAFGLPHRTRPIGRRALTEAADLLAPSPKPGDSFRRAAVLRHLWRAQALLAANRVDEACAAVTLALDYTGDVDSARITTALRTVRAALRTGRHSHPDVRELTPQLTLAIADQDRRR